MSAVTKKLYPADEDDKAMEETILKAIQALTPLPTKIKALVLNTYLLEDKQLNLDLEAELAVITAKYKALAQPLVHRANEIVHGGKVHEEELKGLNDYVTAEEAAKKDEILANLTAVEGYWSTVLNNAVIMKSFIQDKDEEVLKALRDITYSVSTDAAKPHDFTIHFKFGPNDYFENEVLTKVYHMKEEKVCERTTGTEIKWKEGKNLTKKTVTKKQKNKKTGKTRTITKEVDCESFFGFFKTVEAKPEQPAKEEAEDDEEAEEADQMMDHVDFGTTFIDEILPYHLEYYLNIKKDIDYGQGDDEDDDLDDEDDDEEEDEKPKGKKVGGAKGGAQPGGAQKQQCNQQ